MTKRFPKSAIFGGVIRNEEGLIPLGDFRIEVGDRVVVDLMSAADSSVVAARTDYGSDSFAAAVEQGAVVACQFHPEKSQAAGIRLISNFLGI